MPMSDKVQFRAAVVTDIKDGLQEEKEKYGAYFCTLSRLYGLLSYRMPYAGKERSGGLPDAVHHGRPGGTASDR